MTRFVEKSQVTFSWSEIVNSPNLHNLYVSGLSPKHCGTLPFSFITWFAYSGFLVAKLCLILSSDIPAVMTGSNLEDIASLKIQVDNDDDPIHSLDSNLLKVSVGLSALVFIIMLQAHHNHDPDSPHSGYITGVCHNIAVEVFDSVCRYLVFLAKNISYAQNFYNSKSF